MLHCCYQQRLAEFNIRQGHALKTSNTNLVNKPDLEIKTVFSDINQHHRHWLSQPGTSGPINVTLIAGPLRLCLRICLGIVWNSYGLAFRVSKWKLLWQIKFDIWSNPVSQWQRTVGVWSLLTKQGVSEEEDLHFTTFSSFDSALWKYLKLFFAFKVLPWLEYFSHVKGWLLHSCSQTPI